MSPSPSPSRKPTHWIASARRDMQSLPEDVQDVFGSAILDAQYGDIPRGARPFGEGVRPQIWKLAEDHDGDTYRVAFTAVFERAIYVLDVFQKKSKKGVATPKLIRDRIEARFRRAEAHYMATYPGSPPER